MLITSINKSQYQNKEHSKSTKLKLKGYPFSDTINNQGLNKCEIAVSKPLKFGVKKFRSETLTNNFSKAELLEALPNLSLGDTNALKKEMKAAKANKFGKILLIGTYVVIFGVILLLCFLPLLLLI